MKLTTCLFALVCAAPAQQRSMPAEFQGKTSVGQRMPSFSVADTSGKQFSIADQKGKVVLINFWATWCGPCSFEIPRLEKEVWRKYKSDNFVMLAIAREQKAPEIAAFQEKQHFTYPIAADPNRSIYRLFADAGIPRSYVVSTDGTIAFQSEGYNPAEFARMEKVLERELAKASK